MCLVTGEENCGGWSRSGMMMRRRGGSSRDEGREAWDGCERWRRRCQRERGGGRAAARCRAKQASTLQTAERTRRCPVATQIEVGSATLNLSQRRQRHTHTLAYKLESRQSYMRDPLPATLPPHCPQTRCLQGLSASLSEQTTIRVRFAGKKMGSACWQFVQILRCCLAGGRVRVRLFRRSSRTFCRRDTKRDGIRTRQQIALGRGRRQLAVVARSSLPRQRDWSRLNIRSVFPLQSLPRDAGLATPLSMHTASQCKIGKPSGRTRFLRARLLPSVNTNHAAVVGAAMVRSQAKPTPI